MSPRLGVLNIPTKWLSTFRLWLHFFSSVQSLSHVKLFATPGTAACQASLSIINSPSLLKLKFNESVMPSNHLILWLYFLVDICWHLNLNLHFHFPFHALCKSHNEQMTTRARVPNNPTVSVDYFHLLILRHYNKKMWWLKKSHQVQASTELGLPRKVCNKS